MELRDLMSILGVLVALGLGVYNAVRTRALAGTVDTLLLQDKCFDILRTALDTQTLRTKGLTALRKERQRLRTASRQLNPPQKDVVGKCIAGIDNTIKNLEGDIDSDKAMVIDARELVAPEEAPTPEVVKKTNALLGQVRVRHSEAVLGQATTDGLISDAEDLLAVAQM